MGKDSMQQNESPGLPRKVHPAVIAAWAAFVAISGLVPVIPVIGSGAAFSLSDAAVVLAGILFGPVAGTLSAAIGSFLGQLIAPYTAVFGIITFLAPTLAALTAGLLMSKKWHYVVGIFGLVIFAWLLFPLGQEAWFQIFHWIFAIIVAVPAGIWGAGLIKTGDFRKMFAGAFMIAFVGCMASHGLGCVLSLPVLQLPREVWLAVVPIVVPQRIAFAVLAGVIGVPLLKLFPHIGIAAGLDLVKPAIGRKRSV